MTCIVKSILLTTIKIKNASYLPRYSIFCRKSFYTKFENQPIKLTLLFYRFKETFFTLHLMHEKRLIALQKKVAKIFENRMRQTIYPGSRKLK